MRSPMQRRAFIAGTAATAAAAPAAAIGVLDEALARVADLASGLDQLHAIVVARHGEVVLAEAFRGPALTRPANVKSVSKTIVATLTGIALDRGVLESVDQPIVEIIGDRVPAGADPRVRRITIDHLLTMRAGLERTSGVHYGDWVASRDWVAYALGRPFVAEPGGPMLYSTGSYHVLGAVLARAAGRNLRRLTAEWLGQPLGFEVTPWTRDPQGAYLGGNNMLLAPMDLLRFGEMWRQGGVWSGTSVVSGDWIDASWRPHTRSRFSGHAYGYGWFLATSDGHRLGYGRGYGGQMLYVVPDLALTVVVTSDPTRPGRSAGYVGDLHGLVSEHLVPWAERA